MLTEFALNELLEEYQYIANINVTNEDNVSKFFLLIMNNLISTYRKIHRHLN